MPILNYTTKIHPSTSVAEIQRILAKHGVRKIMVEYEADGSPAGLTFEIGTQFGPRGFRMPSRTDGVLKALTRQIGRGKITRAMATRDHARRVAWRILRDWIEVQMALVEAQIVTVDEVLLPYMLGAENRTVWEAMVESRLALPGPR